MKHRHKMLSSRLPNPNGKHVARDPPIDERAMGRNPGYPGRDASCRFCRAFLLVGAVNPTPAFKVALVCTTFRYERCTAAAVLSVKWGRST